MIKREEINKINELDLLDLVQSLGFTFKKVGNDTYVWNEHDSFRISRHKGFYWHSRGFGGDNISCVMAMYDCNFKKAVEIITGDRQYIYKRQIKEKEEETKKEFSLPRKAENGKRAFAYLVKTRGIDPEILKEEFKKGHIYQEAETGNAVFVGYDKGKAVNANLRGVSFKRFVQNREASDFSHPYRVGSGKESLYIYESCIDLLSYLTLYDKDKAASYISLNGTSLDAVDKFIEENPDCKTIIVCSDNDEAGEKIYERLKKKENMDKLILREKPIGKDFNEDLLQKIKGKEMTYEMA